MPSKDAKYTCGTPSPPPAASPHPLWLSCPLTAAYLPAAARRPQVATLPELAQYQLWLVDWGYNTVR